MKSYDQRPQKELSNFPTFQLFNSAEPRFPATRTIRSSVAPLIGLLMLAAGVAPAWGQTAVQQVVVELSFDGATPHRIIRDGEQRRRAPAAWPPFGAGRGLAAQARRGDCQRDRTRRRRLRCCRRGGASQRNHGGQHPHAAGPSRRARDHRDPRPARAAPARPAPPDRATVGTGGGDPGADDRAAGGVPAVGGLADRAPGPRRRGGGAARIHRHDPDPSRGSRAARPDDRAQRLTRHPQHRRAVPVHINSHRAVGPAWSAGRLHGGTVTRPPGRLCRDCAARPGANAQRAAGGVPSCRGLQYRGHLPDRGR